MLRVTEGALVVGLLAPGGVMLWRPIPVFMCSRAATSRRAPAPLPRSEEDGQHGDGPASSASREEIISSA